MSTLSRKITSLLLCLLMLVSFIPVLGNQEAYAGDGMDDFVQGVNSDSTVTAGSTIYVTMQSLTDALGSEFETLYNQKKVKCYFSVTEDGSGGTEHEATLKDGKFSYSPLRTDIGKKICFLTLVSGGFDETYYNRNTEPHVIKSDGKPFIDLIGNMTSDGKITVFGDAGSESRTFTKIVLYTNTNGDNQKEVDSFITGIDGQKTFTKVIDMSKYPVNWFELKAELTDGYVYYDKVIPALITEKPTIKKNSNFFSTGYNYICFMPYFTVPFDVHTGEKIFGYIYLQLYDTKTKQWGDVYGPFDSYQRLKTQYFKGKKGQSGSVKLAANRAYKARIYYAKSPKYAGTAYPTWGPFSSIVTIKTGKSTKPAVKSVTVKAKKVKKVTLIQHAHWDISGKWIPYKKSYAWTTTYKVTVKLKKKPGTAGIYIGSKKCKGNKKKYTATFTDSGKLKGKKIKVQICTYNDNSIGAYGPVVTKKVKMK